MKKKPKLIILAIGVAIVIFFFSVFMILTVPEAQTEEALPQTVDLQ